jgi:hypothetical protein
MDKELEEFYTMLEGHDWYFDYSDDHRAWDKGRKERYAIQAKMQENDKLRKLWEAYADYIWKRTDEKPNIDDYR